MRRDALVKILKEYFLKEDTSIFFRKKKRLLNIGIEFGKKTSFLDILVKYSILVAPLIYILGTIMLIMRNSKIGFPFAPLSIIQFAVMVVYLIFLLLCYLAIDAMLATIINDRKKKNFFFDLLLLSILLGGILYLFSYLIPSKSDLYGVFLAFFVIVPIFFYLFFRNELYFLKLGASILCFMIIIQHIPMSLGGLKEQKVIFYDEIKQEEVRYDFYGIVDGIYQFSDSKNIYLIPIDKGYIKYEKLKKED